MERFLRYLIAALQQVDPAIGSEAAQLLAAAQETPAEAVLTSLINELDPAGGDIALVLDEVAVITRPGAASRRPEIPAVMDALRVYRRLLSIEAPGTLDGGDVLRLGRTLYVGLAQRSNRAGVDQLRHLVRPFGYSVEGIPVKGCLHLKSAVTQVAEDTLLINPEWVAADVLEK